MAFRCLNILKKICFTFAFVYQVASFLLSISFSKWFFTEEYPFKPPITFEVLNDSVSHYCFFSNLDEASNDHKTLLPQSMSSLFHSEWSPALTIERLLLNFLATFDSSLVRVELDGECDEDFDYKTTELLPQFRELLEPKHISYLSLEESFRALELPTIPLWSSSMIDWRTHSDENFSLNRYFLRLVN